MAPFRRGRSAPRGSLQDAGGARGRGFGQGRGRGTGGLYRGQTKSIFHSTRVEEPVGDDAQSERTHTDEDEDSVLDDISASSGSETEDETVAIGKPYNDLLQSLNADKIRSEPQRKKPKLQENNDQRHVWDFKGPSGGITTSKHDKDASFPEQSEEEIEQEMEDEGDGDDSFSSETFGKTSDTEHEDTGTLYIYFRTSLTS